MEPTACTDGGGVACLVAPSGLVSYLVWSFNVCHALALRFDQEPRLKWLRSNPPFLGGQSCRNTEAFWLRVRGASSMSPYNHVRRILAIPPVPHKPQFKFRQLRHLARLSALVLARRARRFWITRPSASRCRGCHTTRAVHAEGRVFQYGPPDSALCQAAHRWQPPSQAQILQERTYKVCWRRAAPTMFGEHFIVDHITSLSITYNARPTVSRVRPHTPVSEGSARLARRLVR